jgi:hypothetical protein
MKISAHFQQKNGGDPTVEWMLARVGIVTASEMDNLITPEGKMRTGDTPKTYMYKKIAERWIGGGLASFNSFSMEQGQILEEKALPYAAVKYDLDIQQVGFITTNDGMVGCSPDGLIGFDANWLKDSPTPYNTMRGGESGIEIKCPELHTHIKYLLAGELPKDYVAQVQGSMYVTGCPTWHFLSYRRNMPPLHLVIERDEKFQANLKTALDSFMKQYFAELARLITINGGEPDNKTRGIVPFIAKPPEEMFSDKPDLIL